METTRLRLAQKKLSACNMMSIATGNMLLFFSPDFDTESSVQRVPARG